MDRKMYIFIGVFVVFVLIMGMAIIFLQPKEKPLTLDRSWLNTPEFINEDGTYKREICQNKTGNPYEYILKCSDSKGNLTIDYCSPVKFDSWRDDLQKFCNITLIT